MIWIAKHPRAHPDMLGYLPDFVSEHDPRLAREQFADNYRNGGGWNPFPGFVMQPDGNITYPGDPPMRLLFEAKLRNETIRLYDCSWVAIIQEDGTYEISRMD